MERVKVGPGVGCVLIDKSQGVQAGDHNRQLNNFRFEVEQPRVSVKDILSWHPLRQQAFAKLLENPNGRLANWTFRQCLSGSLRPTGNVRFIGASVPGSRHISAQSDGQGRVVIERSRGVQAGSWNTQNNKFDFRIERPTLSLESVLRDNPALTRSLALTARQPKNAAVERSFMGQLAKAYESPGSSLRTISGLPREAGNLTARHGMGVQFGRGNHREDNLKVTIGRMRLTHWVPARTMPGPASPARVQPQVTREPSAPVARVTPSRLGRSWPSPRGPGLSAI